MQKQKLSKEELIEERRIKALMATKDSRAWVWDRLSRCGVFRSSYVSNSLDMSFNEGRRDVGLSMLSDIQRYAFDAYQMMEAEAREDFDEQVNEETDYA